MFLKTYSFCVEYLFIYLFVILIAYKITFSQHDPTQNTLKKYHFGLPQKDLSQTTDMC